MSEQPGVREPSGTTVRPRLVWAGTAVALIGLVVTSFGVMALNRWVGGGGAAMTILGLAVAWRGGLLYDARGAVHPVKEIEEVIRGDEHEGVSPASEVVDAVALRSAERLTERKESILEDAGRHPWPSPRFAAAYGLVAIGGWLVVGQGFLGYPFTVTGQDDALRDVGFAVFFVLCGLVLRLPRRHLVLSGIAVASSILLLTCALFLPHGSPVVRGNELVTGCLAMLCALMTTRP